MKPIFMCQQSYLYLRARMRVDERGSSLVEYALLLMLIAMVCLLAVTYLGKANHDRFSNVASQIITA